MSPRWTLSYQQEMVVLPWKECNVMDERVKFIARFLEGEKVAVLCRVPICRVIPKTGTCLPFRLEHHHRCAIASRCCGRYERAFGGGTIAQVASSTGGCSRR